jgi:hypothetical protein
MPQNVGVLNATGYPVEDDTLRTSGVKAGRWVSIRGKSKWNVYITGTTVTAKVNASMDGQTEHHDGFVAALTKDSLTANIQTDKPVPFVQVEVTAGSADRVLIYATD